MRFAIKKKGMVASTHLVLQSPDGTKYQAAKKWGLPAVSMLWILESARTGQKAAEEKFLVDLPPSPGSEYLCLWRFIFWIICSLTFSSSTEREDESFVGGSQKPAPAARNSPEIPLPGPQSGKAVTPLDLGRFQSKVFRSVLDEMKPKDGLGTPKESSRRKEASLQLDTPSRFLSRDQLFRPSFNVKVGIHQNQKKEDFITILM